MDFHWKVRGFSDYIIFHIRSYARLMIGLFFPLSLVFYFLMAGYNEIVRKINEWIYESYMQREINNFHMYKIFHKSEESDDNDGEDTEGSETLSDSSGLTME